MNDFHTGPLGAVIGGAMPAGTINTTVTTGTFDQPAKLLPTVLVQPDYPVEMLGEAQRDIEVIAEATGTRPDYAANMHLASIAGALQPNNSVRVRPGWIERLNLSVCNVGESGAGKSQPANIIVSRHRKAAKRVNPSTDVNEARLVVSNNLSAAAMVNIPATASTLLYCDEMPVDFLPGRDFRNLFLQAANGQSYDYHRGNQTTITIEALALSTALSTQPDALVRAFGGPDDGAFGRFLFAWPEKAGLTFPTEDPDDEAAFERLERLNTVPSADHRLTLDKDALERFSDFYAEIRASTLTGKLGSAWAKFPGLAARLAGVLTMCDWAYADASEVPTVVAEAEMVRALILIKEYYQPTVRRVHGLLEKSAPPTPPVILAQMIRAYGMPMINARALERGEVFPGFRGTKAMMALQALVHAGWVRPAARTGKAGRPPVDFEVSPAVFVTSMEAGQ